ILISGGGRCNFTNTGVEPHCFISENLHFAKSALSRYTQWDFLALLESHKIAWHQKTLGQLFCDGSARQVVAMLLDECAKGQVEVRLSTEIGEIVHRNGLFYAAGEHAQCLVIATGGPSIPKMGATGVAYDIARQFGLGVVTPRPALVPFTLGEVDQAFKEIAGVSVPAIARVDDAVFEEAALFTHRGLSGPSILQISSYWSPGRSISLNILPNAHAALKQAKRDMPRARLKAALSEHLPKRLADALDRTLGIGIELANVPDATLTMVADTLTNLEFHPTGTEGYAKAEVTAGGIDTRGLSSRTMEAKDVPGLFAIGEAVDVTGWLGGYNFQWAWSSAVAAGEEIAKRRTP
ncbi:MAG: NAD(P)/FAD-dependent oxidoreductase, partial [Boseongicola sp.]|nr:NAD(P)/FAD-dependent oxidoreductase [Boseongicola sp.]